jgi:hypothetical protein
MMVLSVYLNFLDVEFFTSVGQLREIIYSKDIGTYNFSNCIFSGLFSSFSNYEANPLVFNAFYYYTIEVIFASCSFANNTGL